MKKIFVLFAAVFAFGCNNAAPVAKQNTNTNAQVVERSGDLKSVAAHTTENENPTMTKSDTDTKKTPTQSSRPLGDPIDVTEYNEAIKTATKKEAAKPNDPQAKKDLGDAFFARGFALTEARQYASALGDYRRTIKYDPENQEAKTWIAKIESIYKLMKIDAPKVGEEPEPLPFKK